MGVAPQYSQKIVQDNAQMIGVDLFAGAGGMSLGAEMAAINVRYAVEKDISAAKTYALNHPTTKVYQGDISNVHEIPVKVPKRESTILFGGPPCQGFSISNRRTRTSENLGNWLFKEFVRIAHVWSPDWIVLENVKGIEELDRGDFINSVLRSFRGLGYTCSHFTLNAVHYGVPQVRNRFFLIGSKHGLRIEAPKKTTESDFLTVEDAIGDLPHLSNGASEDKLPYLHEAISSYARMLRGKRKTCTGHLVSKNSELVIARYAYVPQGGNWEDIPDELMATYTDKSRCHTGVYRRLSNDAPSIVLGNYRKNMLIHPTEDRGLSVREAARLQSFPDSYLFEGSLGSKQQQVGNAVPPKLAKAVFECVLESENTYGRTKRENTIFRSSNQCLRTLAYK